MTEQKKDSVNFKTSHLILSIKNMHIQKCTVIQSVNYFRLQFKKSITFTAQGFEELTLLKCPYYVNSLQIQCNLLKFQLHFSQKIEQS